MWPLLPPIFIFFFLPLTLPEPQPHCSHCCDDLPAEGPTALRPAMPEIRTYINMTILKGDKGDRGDRGTLGKPGVEGPPGLQGVKGMKGSKGQAGAPGNPCKAEHVVFSVGRRKALHGADSYQALLFDTVFVNSPEHLDMFSGKFHCRVPGVYFFNVNIHTWNFKETYMHIMQQNQERAIVYTQPGERSIMQSQSVMLPVRRGDDVWVRLYKRERDNAVYSDDVDVYITFNGYLVKADEE